MSAKFEIYRSSKGFRWRLKAGNGETVAQGQEYTTKDGAMRGCEAVKRASEEADIYEILEDET